MFSCMSIVSYNGPTSNFIHNKTLPLGDVYVTSYCQVITKKKKKIPEYLHKMLAKIHTDCREEESYSSKHVQHI